MYLTISSIVKASHGGKRAGGKREMYTMYEGKYTKHYSNEELDVKIHTFLHRKFEKYPELIRARRDTPVSARPYLGEQLGHTLVSGRHLSAV